MSRILLSLRSETRKSFFLPIHCDKSIIIAVYVTEDGDCRLQLCDKQQQHTSAAATATQFGPPVSGKVCSCSVAGLAALPADVVTATSVADRSSSPVSPAHSNPDSPASRRDGGTPGVSVPEDLRGTSRPAPATGIDSSVDKEGKKCTGT
jgi:hypothetical protein